MATSGSISTSWFLNVNKMRLSWERTAFSTVDNNSTIAWKLEMIIGNGGGFESINERHWSVMINNGMPVGGTVKLGTVLTNRTIEIASGTTVIPHNPDGTKTFPLSFKMELDFIGTEKSTQGSGTGVLDPINRQSFITSAPNFTDEEEPQIFYTPVFGDGITLQAGIAKTSGEMIVPYRNLDIGSDNYRYDFTATDLTNLRAAVTWGASTPVKFVLRTIIASGGVDEVSSITKTLTLVNAEPTLTPTITDANGRTIELTGDPFTFIKDYSEVYFSSGAKTRKGATIVSQRMTCGSQRFIDMSSGYLDVLDGDTLEFTVTDSRGLTAKAELRITLIPYHRPTCHIEVTEPNTKGEMRVTISGKFFNGSFGTKNNSDLQFQYYLAANGEQVNEGGWPVLEVDTPSISNGEYSTGYTFTGLNYLNTYTIQVNVIDELVNGMSNVVTTKTTPIFDWSKTDFKHNTKVYFEDNVYLGERKTIRGKTLEGGDLQLLGLNASDNLSVGWGGYNTGEQDTLIYGTNLEILTKEKIKINGSELADYVVEHKSTGTWHYRKWKSGRVELSGYMNISNLACNIALGGWYQTSVQYSNLFPFNVYNPKVVASYSSDGYGALIWFTTRETMTKPGNFYLIRPTSATIATGVVNFYVTGTWF